MKKKLVLLLSFLMVFAVTLFACDPIKLSFTPSSNATVFGNGGSAVVKDNYLYFANAYVDYSTLGIQDNKYDKNSNQITYAIYRVKLDNEGNVPTSNGTPTGVELVTYNIGGYAYSGLYICGDYLYYSTPFSQSNSSGETVSGLVRFERVKLDGTKRETIYSSTNYNSSSDYDIVYVDGTTYIVIMDASSNLSIIKCKGGNINKYENIASNVKSIKLYEQKDIVYGQTMPDAYKFVYYTVNENNNYYLCRKPLDNSTDAVMLDNSASEIKLLEVKNNRIYYTVGGYIKSISFGSSGMQEKNYASSFAVSESDSGTITSLNVLDDNNVERGILGVYYDGTNYTLYLFDGEGSSHNLAITSTNKITLLASQNGEVLYQIADDTSLYLTSLNFGTTITTTQPSVIAPNFALVGDNEKSKFDFDTQRVYVYKQVSDTSLQYLTVYNIANPYQDDDGNIVGQYAGVLTSADAESIDE